jgi:rhamnose transport system ATP-binding protein
VTLLQAIDVQKGFAGVQALRGVSLELAHGEVHALVGENGAGKSTLIKVITGAVQPDAGKLLIDDQPLVDNNPIRARGRGIVAIYQQPALFAELSVAENIALGSEPRGAWRRIRWSARRRRARELLARIGAAIDVDTPVQSLSMPEQQLVEIARALGADARIVIMDEPTASLSAREVQQLFGVINELASQQVGILYVSHRLDELFQIAHRVTVLRDGARIATRAMASVDQAELIRLMVGREVSSVFPKQEVAPGELLLEVHNLACQRAGLQQVNLQLRAGEILGLAGLVGAGRTELARTLFGLAPADAGEIRLRGTRMTIDSPQTAIRHGIAYVPEDRRRHGVILDLPVAANTALSVLDKLASRGWLNESAEAELARSYVDRLQIKTPGVQSLVGTLSGGNQQKVALARWLATRPDVLILDEPTQGVDVGAKAEIHRLMSQLAAEGIAILMISSELPEILGMSDRIAVMHAGTIVATLPRSEATQERILELALGRPERRASA